MLMVALYPNIEKPESKNIVKRIVEFFVNRDVTIMVPAQAGEIFELTQYATPDIEKKPADFALCLGGDGTLLGVCRRYADNPVPVCGINIGNLGFLVDIEIGELEVKLQKLYDGCYHVETRPFIECWLLHEGCDMSSAAMLGYAVNDIVVTKGDTARIISLGLSVNDTHLIDCNADGFIIASPTGSTAYSLSAGGPIMSPNVRGLLLTPICAHTLNIRPLIIAEHDIASIQLKNTPQENIVSLDGQEQYILHPGDRVIAKTSKVNAGIIKFKDKDYFMC